MKVDRRTFLKLTGAAATTTTFAGLGFNVSQAKNQAGELKTVDATATTTTCHYCSVACGIIVHSSDNKVIYTEGDPENPNNRGALCSKGSAMRQWTDNEQRVTKVKYRAPGSTDWEEKSWDWALDKIAQRVKDTRDQTFVEEEDGITVNRTEGIASIGSAVLENEACYLLVKMMRAMGLVNIEHHARI
ncbi:dehydrogenase [Natroniella sulfidigena]|nr:dehydrogenase [Natroniella sulfidigena]